MRTFNISMTALALMAAVLSAHEARAEFPNCEAEVLAVASQVLHQRSDAGTLNGIFNHRELFPIRIQTLISSTVSFVGKRSYSVEFLIDAVNMKSNALLAATFYLEPDSCELENRDQQLVSLNFIATAGH